MIELTMSHWMYLAGTLLIILTMLFRQNVVVPAILMTFLVGWIFSGSLSIGLQTIFQASLIAAGELFNIFLIIAIMTALLHALKDIGADEQMITPFQKVMVNGHISFWVIVLVTYSISLFFWPTPAVPLVGALLIPVAIRAGLPPIGAAIAISLAGQGMALSSDYIIQIAPMLSATAAGVDISLVADRAFVLSLVTGGIAITTAYLLLRKWIKSPSKNHLIKWEKITSASTEESNQTRKPVTKKSMVFALLVPASFLFIIVYMVMAKFSDVIPSIEGGTGAALIGGTAALLLLASTTADKAKTSLTKVSEHLITGFVFAFKAMGPVIPIAGFFFIGSGELAGTILGVGSEASPSFLFDLVQAGQQLIPESAFLAGFAILIIGMITGLDGSGFSGLPLVGALSSAIGPTVGVDTATLAAIGQMGSIWVGGGTLIAWSSLVAVAGFAKVPVMELVRKSFLPVILGLIAATLFGLWFF
ncbi:putative transport protein [Alkalihalophilus pseudofirmus OF4]|uniref:Transport protein n=1 Tax=Alkalihalophilus pseudofirmus (strain ATCC BAA-2126 / JCM 17055 / OF4) TaxID=398511 RepID=D3FSS4_ALKPO|nr:putative transport protein [Alkalihalophilus pseudofirmus OF4]